MLEYKGHWRSSPQKLEIGSLAALVRCNPRSLCASPEARREAKVMIEAEHYPAALLARLSTTNARSNLLAG
jgi:hypothetical protein